MLARVHQRRRPSPPPHSAIAAALDDDGAGAEDVLEAVAHHQRPALHANLRRRPRHGAQVHEHVTIGIGLDDLRMTDFL